MRGLMIFVAAVCIFGGDLRAATYRVTDLGVLPGTQYSAPYAINNAGQVVGFSGSRAFIWDAENGMRDLGVLPGASWSIAYGINNKGQVVGSSGKRAFIWDAENGMRDLGVLPGHPSSVARDINDQGHVVGYGEKNSTGTNGNSITPRGRAFLWDVENGMRDLGVPSEGGFSYAIGINDAGQIVGDGDLSASYGPILWNESGERQSLGLPPGGVQGSALKINDLGQAVGEIFIPGRATQAVLWDATGEPLLLDAALETGESYAYGVNNLGQVVGAAWTERGDSGFLWDRVGGMRFLDDLVDPEIGWSLFEALALNDRGWITGQGRSPDGGIRGFLLVAEDAVPALVPLPAPAMLLTAGLAMLGATARRKRRAG